MREEVESERTTKSISDTQKPDLLGYNPESRMCKWIEGLQGVFLVSKFGA